MLTIRLIRKGKKNQPFFRLIVTDKRNSAKGGRAVEILGYVDPLTKRKSLEKDRILYWISKGAKPSDTVNNLLIQEKVIEGQKINVSKLSKKKQAEMAKASASAKATADKKEEAVAKAKAGEPKPVEDKAPETETPVEKLPAAVEPAPVETPVEKPTEQPAEPEKPTEQPPKI